MTISFPEQYRKSLLLYLNCFFLKKTIKIYVSPFTVKKSLEEDPYYPHKSLSDSLTLWKVPNQSLQLKEEACVIEELPLPFIAHLSDRDGRFQLIGDINAEISYILVMRPGRMERFRRRDF